RSRERRTARTAELSRRQKGEEAERDRRCVGSCASQPPVRRIPTVRVLRGIVLIVALLGASAATPVARADDSGTPCAFEADVSLSPGLSRSPSSGTFDTNGESGTLDCQGNVGGQPVTGRG